MIRTFLFAISAMIAINTSSFADGDIENGEKVYKKCKACHMVGENAKKSSWPSYQRYHRS